METIKNKIEIEKDLQEAIEQNVFGVPGFKNKLKIQWG